MFAKTFCRPGAFLSVVPVGLRTTLQYNAEGLLEKVFIGYDDSERINVSNELLTIIGYYRLLPLSIPTKGGTTWVKGVLYTKREFFNEGTLPMCIEQSLISYFKENPSDYEFFGGHVESLATSFTSAMVIKNWLSMAKFSTLPSYIISSDLSEQSFVNMVNNDRFPFKFPLISGYMIHEMGKFKYVPLNLHQSVASKITKQLDVNGYISATIHTGAKDIVTSYADVVRLNINANSSVVQTENGNIIYSTCTDGKKRDKRSSKLTCSVCGNLFTAPSHGPVCCTDIHCRSRLYPDICHFLTVLDLPQMSHEKFLKHISSGNILCLTDVLLLDEYKDLPIKATLSKLLESIVPVGVCANKNVFALLANRCNNSVQTLRYYIQNPQRLIIDINAQDIFIRRLIDWLSDGYNCTTIETLLDCGQIELIGTDKKFEGAPIFRDRNILITGSFLHGDSIEISSILQSYDAKVLLTLNEVDSSVSCVLVGALGNQDGGIIQYAHQNNIPIFNEMEFFSKYEIDEDIQSNLL